LEEFKNKYILILIFKKKMETKQENTEKKNSFVYLDIEIGGEFGNN